MKVKIKILVVLIVAVLVACTPAIPPRAENFAFIFQDFSCGAIPVYMLNTADETLIYTPFGDVNSITISLRLSENELESVYQKAMSIEFFAYPSEFIVPDDQIIGFQAPSSRYQLMLTNGETTNSVAWRDDTMTKPGYPKADQLRELMNLITQIIQSYPEVQQLPGGKAACA